MDGMDMSSTGMGDFDPCYLGNNNGSYPNGTLGAGEWAYGHYVPTAGERSACQAANGPWAESVKYGHWTTYFFLSFFVAAAVVNGLVRLDVLSRIAGLASPFAIPARFKALLRVFDQPRPTRYLPPLGTTLVTLALSVFTLSFCFGICPYYRPPNFGSSPLGLRSEWIATALVVWIFATAMKRNALAYLTGLAHGRLMGLHKAFAWICLFFAIVHTVAMMIRARAQEPWSYTWKTNSAYGWSAWAALVTLAWLCVLSLGPVRRFSHELFYPLHIVAALLFIAAMYDHLDRLLGSWSYMHASVVVLGTAFLYRYGATAVSSRLFTRPQTARVELIEDGALCMSIDVEGAALRWSPGQHVFIRFLTLLPWQTHPFTISSLPSSSPSSTSTMRFILRPHSGLTARLLSRASASSTKSFSLPVLLDGPYGPSSVAEVTQAADHILLLAGGTGMSFVAPLLSALTAPVGQGGELSVAKSVSVVWAVPREECVDWFRAEMEKALAAGDAVEKEKGEVVQLEKVSVEVFVTRDGQFAGAAAKSDKDSADSATSRVKVQQGRPAIFEIIAEAVATKTGRVSVVACGPSALLLDARNAAARAQLHILAGKVPEGGASEVVLWEESYEC
ncbi:hypothetical protein JCM10213_008567 [Rhodosporidiobolus nylandii]